MRNSYIYVYLCKNYYLHYSRYHWLHKDITIQDFSSCELSAQPTWSCSADPEDAWCNKAQNVGNDKFHTTPFTMLLRMLIK